MRRFIPILILSCAAVLAENATGLPKAAPAVEVEQATEKEAAAFREALKNLGSDDFEVREKASADLDAGGRKALPFLEAAQKTAADAEVKSRVEKLVKKITLYDGMVTLPSGLRYKILKEGAGANPGPTDYVVVHYAGRFENGTEFDSSYKRGHPATFPVSGVIAGWTEGLQLMKPGAKYTFIIPPNLAYGDHPPGAGIPAGATLIFDVELISVRGK